MNAAQNDSRDAQPRAAVPHDEEHERVLQVNSTAGQENDAEERRLNGVAQPPSAVSGSLDNLAKPVPHYYRRNLPHYQGRGSPLFVSFCTADQFIIPESLRTLVLEHCLHDDGTKMIAQCIVVMPDHVHMIYHPLADSQWHLFSVKEIISAIKGSSSHSINKALKRKGHVWQDERFDHVIRSFESFEEKFEYVRQNPVRRGLVKEAADYPWTWTKPKDTQPRAAVPHNEESEQDVYRRTEALEK